MIHRARSAVSMSVYVLILIACIVMHDPAHARDILLLGGTEGGEGGHNSYNYYGFVAVVAPLFSQQLGNGFVQKYWIDAGGYNYPLGNQTIDATAIGLEGAVGYQTGGLNGWVAAYGGARYANTRLSPDNPDSKVRGSQLRAKLQVEGERVLATRWKVNAIGSYIMGADSYWARGRGLYRVYSDVYSGPELIAQGDPEYRAWQYGWVVTGFEPMPKGSFGIKAGVRKVENAATSGYLGVEISQLF